MAHGVIPVRLAALSAGTVRHGRRTASTPPAEHEPRIFPDSPFIEINVYRVVDDHVLAMHDGALCAYAIGHLPDHVRAMLLPAADLGANLAGTATRTILGMVTDKVIQDLRDDQPTACPIAIAAIRLHALDPARTLREYVARAGILGETTGQETSITGERIVYNGHERRLTVELAKDGWMLERDAIIVPHQLPATICAAAPGRPLAQLVEHAMLAGIDARVAHAESRGEATLIAYETTAVRIMDLPEMKRRTT